MKRHLSFQRFVLFVRCGLCALLTTAVLPVAATEVWTGPSTNFTKPNFASSLDPINQDRMTPNIWLTRDTTRGLYNIAVENSFTSYYSPQDTEWSYGQLANYNSLTYSDWETWNGQSPPSMVGQDAVLHLITDDIYMSIRFTSWGASAGGFSYQRSTPAVPEPSVLTMLLMGLLLAVTAKCRLYLSAAKTARVPACVARTGNIPCNQPRERVGCLP